MKIGIFKIPDLVEENYRTFRILDEDSIYDEEAFDCILDEDHESFTELYTMVMDGVFMSNNRLVCEIESGELQSIEVVEIPTNDNQIMADHALDNLNKTDYQVIKNMEVLMDALAESTGITLPYENLHETRQQWRDQYNDAQEAMNGNTN